MITQEEVKRALIYDPETGVFTYRRRDVAEFKSQRACNAWNGRFALKEAGAPTGHGYIKLTVYRHRVYAHRAAWLYVHGDWPEFIDHKNGDRSDNRLANLRSVSRTENQRNRAVQANNRLRVKGVHKAGNSYIAGITIGGKWHHLGSYRTPQEAAAAYDAAAIKHFGEFASLNGYVRQERDAA